jgi:hypothetical protein
MFFFSGIELKLRESDKMDLDELFDRKDLRKRKDKKRAHRHEKEHDDYGKDSLKKMKEEIDELRKRELERTRELDELKKKVEEQSRVSNSQEKEIEYALEFSKDIYLSKGFIESAKWIKDVIAKNMIEEMNTEENKKRFEIAMINKKYSTCLGIRTCARYNRGEICNYGKWHSTHKPDVPWISTTHQKEFKQGTYGEFRQQRTINHEEGNTRQPIQERLGKKNEIRLHSCTLCMEALGSAVGHNVLNCPWIQQKNWNSQE